jgi:predicted AlkP superfamily phosphohydrolase/phosphomutase
VTDSETDGSVLIIGLDGATFDIIEPMVAAGRLPNLGKLMLEGSWSRLRSTIPVHSAPAWSSFATGMTPGAHGIFAFLAWDAPQQRFRPLNSTHNRRLALWELLGTAGRRVGVVNVPVTYPASPVRGYLVCGMLSTDTSLMYYPPDLEVLLRAAVPDYRAEPPTLRDLGAQLDVLHEQIRKREAAIHHLRALFPTDLTVAVFTALDRAQHLYWRPSRSRDREQQGCDSWSSMGHAIERTYEALDAAVGELVERSREDTTIVIVSDHGFQGVHRHFCVNTWLEEQGYLALRGGRTKILGHGRDLLIRLGLRGVARGLRRRISRARMGRETTALQAESALFLAVDWDHTVAFYGPNVGINLNVEGREARGIVRAGNAYEALRDQLIAELKAFRDPRTGARPVADVLRREEVFGSTSVEGAPDLVVVPGVVNGEYGQEQYFPRAILGQKKMFLHPREVRGFGGHHPEGILIARGPCVRSGQRGQAADIVDIAPTVLYLMGEPIPRAMEGRVLAEFLDPESYASRPPVYADIDTHRVAPSMYVDEEEQLQIEDRLRGLGYLD